ncbi:MAG: hypothetical protein M3O86_02790 [Actinomycetota bacterium]|nr:hypothetical protein [Actinomycetota bacterium]
MNKFSRRPRPSTLLSGVVALFLVVLAPTAAIADRIETARASAFGIFVSNVVEPTPQVEVTAPPDDSRSETVVDVPADPVVTSRTLTASADATEESEIEPILGEDMLTVVQGEELPERFNARGFAVTEDLDALDGNVTADVVRAEALAACIDGEVVLAAGTDIENLTLGDTAIDITGPDGLGVVTGEPNQELIDSAELGLRIVVNEIMTEGNMVSVNALHIETLEGGVLGEVFGEQDIIVSHAEASAECAEGEDEEDPECSDGEDNDGDGRIDFPDDPGCEDEEDDDERDENGGGGDDPECSDGEDNDGDGRIDFPDDPGCDNEEDDDETDENGGGGDEPECTDGEDNDGDGQTDFPDDPGCDNEDDDNETNNNNNNTNTNTNTRTNTSGPADQADCTDGVDNDGDGRTDFPSDPGCNSESDDDERDLPRTGGGLALVGALTMLAGVTGARFMRRR